VTRKATFTIPTSTTRRPTSTTTTTTTTTTPPPQAAIYDGSGDDVIQITKPGQAALLHSVYNSGGNFIVKGLDAGQQQTALFVNVIGGYEGTVPLDFTDTETVFLEVKASGPWHFEVRPLSSMPTFAGTGAGSGDDVVQYTGKTGIAQIDYSGDSNFVVKEYSTSTNRVNLMVNEIGAYSGRVPITGGSGTNVLEIKASGNWTITVS
jgi:hypothetical protein